MTMMMMMMMDDDDDDDDGDDDDDLKDVGFKKSRSMLVSRWEAIVQVLGNWTKTPSSASTSSSPLSS